MRALVLDDSKTTRMILRRMFQQIGFEVSEAEDGAQGLKSIEDEGKPDLITVDWDMPVMDGLAFVRAVRTEYPSGTLPIIMVTIANDRDHVSAALEAGVNEYLMKPFTEEMVREKLELLGVLQD
jgi:two-component system, chemotaxis family, chemotaxis protein CheY